MSTEPIEINPIIELSKFAHSLRHDIRNFLAAIEGYAYLLNDEFNPDYLNRIVRNAKQISQVIDNSVDFADSGLKPEIKVDVDLNHIITSCKSMIPNTVSLDADFFDTVKGDHSKILKIFDIIIDNAIVHGKATEIKIKEEKTNKNTYVRIFNNGIRIPKEKENNLFNVPQTFKNKNSVGLNMARRLCQSHNWQLYYKTSETNLTCFEIVMHN